MSNTASGQEPSIPGQAAASLSTSSHRPRQNRVLACVLCSQRKVKCDRNFPCSNCVKAGVQCVPGTLTQRRRRRRFLDREQVERELLERVHKYESVLRQNNIAFEPLQKDASGQHESRQAESNDDSDDDHVENEKQDALSPANTVKSEGSQAIKSVWHVMSRGFRDPQNDSDSSDDDVRENFFRKAWEQSADNSDPLLFGARNTTIKLSSLHPSPAHIFRHWQVYLDNANPLLKVTHTLSLQTSIIEAVSDIESINPNLEALLFSIYCMSVQSMTAEECQTKFGSSQQDLTQKYQFGCQQALLNCGFLRTSDRDCLTALFLYLISLRPVAVAQSLSSMLGIAARIAQRMGINDERMLAKCTPLEAEMRRRLWWSLVLFDTRIAEKAGWTTSPLNPTWNCDIVHNIHDSDLRPEMKELPTPVPGNLSDAIFMVVRSALSDFTRHAAFHLDLTCPSLKPLAKPYQPGSSAKGSDLDKLEKTIEDQYIQHCDQENPIHFMTLWFSRMYIARCRLMEHNWRHSTSPAPQTEAQRDAASSFALKMLECDTIISNSPLTKRFQWLHSSFFQFPAYVQVLQDLKSRPTMQRAGQAWETMSDNFESRWGVDESYDNPFFKIFAKIASQAWKPCEEVLRQSGNTYVPRLVLRIRDSFAQTAAGAQGAGVEQQYPTPDMDIDEFAMPLQMPMDFANLGMQYDMGMQDGHAPVGHDTFSAVSAPSPLHAQMSPMNWHGAWRGWGSWGGGRTW